MDGQSKVGDVKDEKSSLWSKSPGSDELGNEDLNDVAAAAASPANSDTSISSSESGNSCVASEENHRHTKSPSADVTSLVLGGCTRCHLYVMLQKQNPRCPRCMSSDLVSFFHEWM